MIIGVPKERKDHENRVAVTPAGVKTLVGRGHQVFVERAAGDGSGFCDDDYVAAGAVVLQEGHEVYARSEMILKVKEPVTEEYAWIREDHILFAFLHLAAVPELKEVLEKRRCVAFAFEMVRDPSGSLPILAPMSEVAGRMSIQLAARCLEKQMGGPGIMMGGVPGVAPASVAIVGGGIVGTNAAKIAVGMGADVTVLDANPARLRQLDDLFGGRVKTLISDADHVDQAVQSADAVIGAVLIPGKKTPRIVARDTVKRMKKGSVIVDVSIDQGGCVETADRTTTHSNPVYVSEGVIHYAVPNIPGIVPRTSTFALTHAIMPYVLELADNGWEKVMEGTSPLRYAANVVKGETVAGI